MMYRGYGKCRLQAIIISLSVRADSDNVMRRLVHLSVSLKARQFVHCPRRNIILNSHSKHLYICACRFFCVLNCIVCVFRIHIYFTSCLDQCKLV